jgi:hypothetical protein
MFLDRYPADSNTVCFVAFMEEMLSPVIVNILAPVCDSGETRCCVAAGESHDS